MRPGYTICLANGSRPEVRRLRPGLGGGLRGVPLHLPSPGAEWGTRVGVGRHREARLGLSLHTLNPPSAPTHPQTSQQVLSFAQVPVTP